MAYTNVWTIAAPLDTQAANQGAVDFRATKLDVMQRISSFGAGVLANRPTPEATSGTADWTGVMYWATDTKQVFRWNGASWDDISNSIATGSPSLTTFPGSTVAPADTTLDTLWDYTLLGGTLGATGGFKISFNVGTTVTGGNQCLVYVSFGGVNTQILNDTVSTNTHVEFWILNKTSTTQGGAYFYNQNSGVIHNNLDIGGAVDTTANQHISVKTQKTLAGDTINLVDGYITKL